MKNSNGILTIVLRSSRNFHIWSLVSEFLVSLPSSVLITTLFVLRVWPRGARRLVQSPHLLFGAIGSFCRASEGAWNPHTVHLPCRRNTRRRKPRRYEFVRCDPSWNEAYWSWVKRHTTCVSLDWYHYWPHPYLTSFSLVKHPKLIELCRERGIAVEVCPISNEILVSLL